MPNLSNLVGGSTDYLEYAWVANSTDAAQTLSQNSGWVTLSANTEVADTGNYGSINTANNQITLAAGTYYFEAFLHFQRSDGAQARGVLGLYNITDSVWVTQNGERYDAPGDSSMTVTCKGQFKITTSKVFDLRLRLMASIASNPYNIDNGFDGLTLPASSQFTNSDKDHRTTIKLWKLK